MLFPVRRTDGLIWVCFVLITQNVFHNQVVSRREGEFERLKREREERVAEVRAIRKQEREMRRKMEHYRRQEAARLIKLKEEEEGRKREGEIEIQAAICYCYIVRLCLTCKCVMVFYLIPSMINCSYMCVCYRGGK